MEIKIGTQTILKVLYVLSWILFIGLCIEAGSVFFNAIFTVFFKPEAADYFALTSLYAYDTGHFLVLLLLMAIVAVLKALLFYLIVKILYDKKLDMSRPFNKEMGRFIFKTFYLTLGIGLFSRGGAKFTEWLTGQGVQMPGLERLNLEGAEIWLLMAVILFVMAQIFKRGIEIQSENELTV